VTFDIAWPRKHVEWRGRPRENWFVEALLTERRLVNGRPQMQLFCRLAAIDEEHAHADGSIDAREKFWADASRRLGRLYRLSDRDLDEIEALLVRRAPKPSPIRQAAE
jgi:hypothetical protein